MNSDAGLQGNLIVRHRSGACPWPLLSYDSVRYQRPVGSARRSGGIQGGLANGETIVAKVAFKPTSTISRKQKTVRGSSACRGGDLVARRPHDPIRMNGLCGSRGLGSP